MMRRKRPGGALPLAALGLVLGLAACEDSTSPRDAARVSVFLTDAPGDVESVWIRIDGLTLVGDEHGDIDLPGDFDELIEVSDLVDRAKQLVSEATIEVDSFRQIRLMLGDAVLVTKQGRVFATAGADLPDGVDDDDVGELHCPSCAQTGIKVVFNGPRPRVEEGENVNILIDFDVAQSFGKQAGNSGRWIMRPVVHGTFTTEPGDPIEESNSIDGTVALAVDGQGVATVAIPQCPAGTGRSLTDFIPSATAATLTDADDEPVVRAGIVAANGSFSINGVDPDTYDMGFLNVEVGDATTGDWALTWSATVSPLNVTVVDGVTTQAVNYTVTGASCVAL
jgi:hypothetical protein